MDNVLLFITGVLSGVIAGFSLSRIFGKSHIKSDGSTQGLLQERLLKADQGLEKFSDELENKNRELKKLQQETLEAREKAAVSITQLKAVNEEKDALKINQKNTVQSLEVIRQEKENLSRKVGEITEQLKSQEEQSIRLEKEREQLNLLQQETASAKDQIRKEKEVLSNKMAEIAEQLRSQESQTKFLEQARTDLLSQFRALSGKMLDGSRDALLKTTKETVTEPFSKQVEVLRKQVEELSKDSNEKLGVLAQTTRDLRQRSEDVQGAAQQLTSALRSPNVKGRWGEVNLKRILEFVGLISYCDFDEQVNVGTDDGLFRPDCVITIPGSRRLIIDSKAPIESYLDALKSSNESEQEKALSDHLKKVRSHIDQLSKKDYSKQLSSMGQVVDGVILFIPIEGALSMALERDPNLLEYAFSKNIILTFPTSLLAILKGLSMTIQQAEIAKNIDAIQNNAVELYKRFASFTDKFNAIGTNITRLNKSFNEAVGSYERRLMPQGRRFAELAGQNNDLNLTDGIEGSIKELKGQSDKANN